jgi:2-polyprenyl-3-methyl-5-hydroxy-6-metoxy-1,4-benzoquinol methylase
MIKKIWHQLMFESPCYQTELQGLSLLDIVQKKNIPIDKIAASDFYSAFYEGLEESKFDIEPIWIAHKKETSKLLRNYLPKDKDATILSIGAGIGIVEEDLLKEGFPIELQECQPSSLNYLKSKNVKFNKIICSDLSTISKKYDLIYTISTSYCFEYNKYQQFLKQIHKLLNHNGEFIICECIPNKYFITPKLINPLKRLIKKLLGIKIKPQVFWGWFRHPKLHISLCLKAGFKEIEHFIEKKEFKNNRYELTWHRFKKV